MKHFIILFAALLINCGDGRDPGAPEQPEKECVYCNVVWPEDEPIPEPTPYVSLAPLELLFYYVNDRGPYPPGHTRLENRTNETIEVLSANIVSLNQYSDDSSYFILSDISFPITLNPGQELIFYVTFLYSNTQQIAILEIQTSYEDDLLTAALYGKTFEVIF